MTPKRAIVFIADLLSAETSCFTRCVTHVNAVRQRKYIPSTYINQQRLYEVICLFAFRARDAVLLSNLFIIEFIGGDKLAEAFISRSRKIHIYSAFLVVLCIRLSYFGRIE